MSRAATAELDLRAAARGWARVASERVNAWLAPALVVALAAGLRLRGLGHVPLNPFYDAAVRSMGTSWHAFVTGAIDPSARVAIDKPPVDLWLQVLSTKWLGFTPMALHLPEALGGTLAVLALYDLLRVLFGRGPALGGALALAVLPMAIITSRSDTMDSVMAMLVIVAAALTARAGRDGRPWLLVGAGAVLGLAFEVKLFEALVAAPALAGLWWFGASGSTRRRLLALGGATVTFGVIAVAWLAALPVLGGHDRPWAFGSTNGSPWQATFVYDGLDRLRGLPSAGSDRSISPRARATALPTAPGPGRLFSAGAQLDRRIGVALAAAVLAFGIALLAGVPRGLGRDATAGWWAMGGWLATGAVLMSAQQGLKPRYLEAVDPAVAAVLGTSLVLTGRRLAARVTPGRRARAIRWIAAATLVGLLAAPTVVSAGAVAGGAEDAGAPGALPEGRVAALATYLDAHRGGARYQAASIAVGKAASLIAHDGQPVLVLAAAAGRPLVTVPALARAVASGAVRYALVGSACTRRADPRFAGCPPAARWIRAHGVDVSRAAGQPHPGLVYALSARRPTGRSTSVASSRRRGARRGRPRPASRARRR